MLVSLGFCHLRSKFWLLDICSAFRQRLLWHHDPDPRALLIAYRDIATLGETFLRCAYVVFDLDNKQASLAQSNINSTTSNIIEFVANESTIPHATGVVAPSSITATSTSSTSSPTSIRPPSPSKNNTVAISVGVIVPVVVLLAVAIGFFLWRKRRAAAAGEQVATTHDNPPGYPSVFSVGYPEHKANGQTVTSSPDMAELPSPQPAHEMFAPHPTTNGDRGQRESVVSEVAGSPVQQYQETISELGGLEESVPVEANDRTSGIKRKSVPAQN